MNLFSMLPPCAPEILRSLFSSGADTKNSRRGDEPLISHLVVLELGGSQQYAGSRVFAQLPWLLNDFLRLLS
jgi:hypothetical protein